MWLARGGPAPPRASLRLRSVDAELPERVSVLGRALGSVHPDIAAVAGDRQVRDATGARRGGVDGGPRRGVVGRLDLEGPRIGRFPVQHDPADRVGRTQVHANPLWIAESA